jgi:hypothetical protein
MATDLYKKPSKVFDVYGTDSENVSGIDMRKELNDILYTQDQGTHIVYRRVKFENGVPKKCECTKANRGHEPDKDIPCESCGGMGYYYNDILTRTYINHSQAYSIHTKHRAEGTSQIEYKTAYLEWDFIKNAIDDGDNIPNRFDRIIQLNKDLSGKILSPSTAREFYEILSVDPYRLDNSGRIEYYRCRIISVIDKSFLV